MTETKPYRTTEAAGFFVASKRVPSRTDEDGNRVPVVGHVLRLTDAEAKYELLQGTIEPADPAGVLEASEPAKKKTKA